MWIWLLLLLVCLIAIIWLLREQSRGGDGADLMVVAMLSIGAAVCLYFFVSALLERYPLIL
jgi:hypothetical protein